MTATSETKYLVLYPFRVMAPLPRDMMYAVTHDVFNLLDAFRASESGLRLFADAVSEKSDERADEIRKLVEEIDSIADDVRPVVDVLIAARKRYADFVERLSAVVEAPL